MTTDRVLGSEFAARVVPGVIQVPVGYCDEKGRLLTEEVAQELIAQYESLHGSSSDPSGLSPGQN